MPRAQSPQAPGLAVLFAVCTTPTLAAQTPNPFTEEAVERGIQLSFGQTAITYGTGLAFADLDADGDDDLVILGRADGKPAIYENDGHGYFSERPAATTLSPLVTATGITAADYDADGDLDLYISQHVGPNFLLRNDGDFSFSDVSLASGTRDTGWGQGCAWGDYDRDGWIDLYVSNRTQEEVGGIENRLYRNQGNGTFEDVAPLLGVTSDVDRLTFQATFSDYNRDGWPDLYLCTDKGMGCEDFSNRLFKNVRGVFTDVTYMAGAQACVGCMGIGVGDFDANGHPDFYCTNIPLGNVLLLNNGNETFTESSATTATGSYLIGWGNLMFDFDNDGRQDIYVCNNNGPNRLYRNRLPQPCDDLAADLGVDVPGQSFCSAVSDVDLDGDLDLVVQARGEAARLFINHEGDRRNWLQLELRASGPNGHAVGARVETLSEGTQQTYQVHAGTGLKSMSSMVVQIGLGSTHSLERARIVWPDGGVQVLENVAANQRLTVIQRKEAPLYTDVSGEAR